SWVTDDVAFATTGGTPMRVSAPNDRNVPPPATAFIMPVSTPERNSRKPSRIVIRACPPPPNNPCGVGSPPRSCNPGMAWQEPKKGANTVDKRPIWLYVPARTGSLPAGPVNDDGGIAPARGIVRGHGHRGADCGPAPGALAVERTRSGFRDGHHPSDRGRAGRPHRREAQAPRIPARRYGARQRARHRRQPHPCAGL